MKLRVRLRRIQYWQTVFVSEIANFLLPQTVIGDLATTKSNSTNFPEKNSFTLEQLYYLCFMDGKPKQRTTIFYKNYFDEFFVKQREKVKAKIIWTLELIEELERVPETYLKHIENTDGLYEIRVQQGSDIFRIFCFFDQGQLIIITNGFQKKTQKTPKKEIEKAIKIKNEYESEKQ